MFNFLKKKETNPTIDILNSLSDIHKESVVSLFIVLAGSDQHLTEGVNSKEFAYINKHIEIFDLKNQFTILENFGIDGILKYLKELTPIQQESLIILTWGLLAADFEPNEDEIDDMNNLLNEIGISTEKILQTLKI